MRTRSSGKSEYLCLPLAKPTRASKRRKFFQSPQGAGGATSSINKIFDSYRDSPDDNPDGIGIEGAMKFLGDIQVQLDEVTCLGIAELLKSPSMGEFTREGFLNGWRAVG
ncbi:unnamed protein product [Aspergillus oryzae RIB40]|uniref:DNA, SC102 n=2 Tax=Aspergillus subgen. Circumdati TaxID=2720871 RepID=Q2UB46_ASPOR|nr:unnamed protein product [Aspergillus oryzae RIB40]BAE61219.1 unnamed protein product [Aspergillus oryzae RIB40]